MAELFAASEKKSAVVQSQRSGKGVSLKANDQKQSTPLKPKINYDKVYWGNDPGARFVWIDASFMNIPASTDLRVLFRVFYEDGTYRQVYGIPSSYIGKPLASVGSDYTRWVTINPNTNEISRVRLKLFLPNWASKSDSDITHIEFAFSYGDENTLETIYSDPRTSKKTWYRESPLNYKLHKFK